jgi:uroporphyrinogen decarboxylase
MTELDKVSEEKIVISHRERVLKTLRGQELDRVARGEFFIDDEFARTFLGVPGAVEFQQLRAMVEELDLDVASVSMSGGWGALEHPSEERAFDFLSRWRNESDRFVFALIDGPFSASARTRGFEMLMHLVKSTSSAAQAMFRQGAEESLVVARAVRDAGAEGVILGEDIAYGRTTYLSPKDLRALYFPVLRDLVREIHSLGLVVFFHSDGNLNAILKDIAACEVDGIQGLEPDAGMILREAREKVGESIALWGNLSSDFLSAQHTLVEIDQALQSLVPFGTNSKLIWGSCSGLGQGMNPDTVRQVYRAMNPFCNDWRNHGRGID